MSTAACESKFTATTIDAQGMHFRELNERVRAAIAAGDTSIELTNVNGQRYIGVGIDSEVRIEVRGVPGNDMGAFMDGPTVVVHGNAQDGIGNTMNGGSIIVHGDAGDVIGYGMRGGRILIRGQVGYRVGIHMKAYRSKTPVLVAGGTAGDFLGEYMAGGILVVLGLTRWPGQPLVGDYCATGIHGGAVYLRGEWDRSCIATHDVAVREADGEDMQQIRPAVEDFCTQFGFDPDAVLNEHFDKLTPLSHRPYGAIYAT
jgi:glutamate synthase domain-containing protein 3